MERCFCDVEGCKEIAFQKQIDVCTGWLHSTDSFFGKKDFKPFERPNVSSRDLCEKHFMQWCRATYTALFGDPEKTVKRIYG